MIFILNATIPAASLQPFTYWKGEWITREVKLIDAKRCTRSTELSCPFSPLLMYFIYSLQLLCRCIFQGSQTFWDVKRNNEKKNSFWWLKYLLTDLFMHTWKILHVRGFVQMKIKIQLYSFHSVFCTWYRKLNETLLLYSSVQCQKISKSQASNL